jgi:hypothetical protein
LTQRADELEIVIQSEDTAPYCSKRRDFFQANAYLQSRKSIQRIIPSHVRYERDEKGFVAAAVFLFPRNTESGAPTISPDEKTVEFTCKIEGSTLRVAFELQKMVDQNGLALRTPRRLAAIAVSVLAVIRFFSSAN